MKNVFLFLAFALSCFAIQAQTFELEKSEPKMVLKFREIVPDTFEADLLFDGKLIEGRVVRSRYKCTFDYNEKHEGEIYYAQPTLFLAKDGKELDNKKVLGWNLHGNGFAYINNNRWFNSYGGLSTTLGSYTLCSTAGVLDSMPTSTEATNEDFLPNGKTIEINER